MNEANAVKHSILADWPRLPTGCQGAIGTGEFEQVEEVGRRREADVDCP